MKACVEAWRALGRRLHFIPTMGALHAGHRSLFEMAARRPDFQRGRDRLVASIFVNPAQFNDPEDFCRYPQTLEADRTLSRAAGVDLLFLPTAEAMYPEKFQTEIVVKDLSLPLCGKSRPGHFSGVATVVTKLFNIAKPHFAYFGEKDFQQLAIIRRLVWDLNLDIEIVPCPIVREPDGLAMSSRNAQLAGKGRERARVLWETLEWARAEIAKGAVDLALLKREVERKFSGLEDVQLDYAEFVESDKLAPLARYLPGGKTRMLLAAFVDGVRLIDNAPL